MSKRTPRSHVSSTPDWPPFRYDPEVRQAKALIIEFHPHPKDIRVAARVYISRFRATGQDVTKKVGPDGVFVMAAIQGAAIVNHIDHGTAIDSVELDDTTLTRIVNGIHGTTEADPEFIRRAASVAAFLIDPVASADSVRKALR